MERVSCPLLLLLLLVLLPPPLRASTATAEPAEEEEEEACELDEDGVRCACNFTGPQPAWSSALQCVSALRVEIRGGGRSLDGLLSRVDAVSDPRRYQDVVKTLRLQRLRLGEARVPAPLLAGALRVLGFSRLEELALEDLEVTGTLPPPPPEAAGPALTALSLRNVSWASGGAWLADLQPWLRPGLRALTIAQAPALALACDRVRPLAALTTLDLSDNPALGERGLTSALCPHKFPALRSLALRNAGLQAPGAVCAALANAGAQPGRLDLSHNPLSAAAAPAPPQCVWPAKLTSLNLSSAGLKQVPKGLPAQLSELDLSGNQLDRAPLPGELPTVGNLSLHGNPFLEPGALKPQEDIKTSGVGPAWALSPLAVGVSGTLALLQGARRFA
ncbi:monocyte differentiation antigen CD14 [Perognathus longimembris pacificus]|uniref:monocyte differentiation antigen CD14 n=1 Tax=Perognathus longimembris pacificus TaxID=214514 RepID=UPI002018CA30|nr:monocyte differentiation antigen CD14 [Perognathus longimembris pacificus]